MNFVPRAGLHRFDPGRLANLVLRPNWPRFGRTAIAADIKPQDTELARNGTTVLQGLISPEVCARAVQDYEAYEARLVAARVRVKDAQNRNYRLTNFHLASPSAMEIGCHPAIHQALDAYFGARSMVYTSLYYKHGSQQKTHLDTPFFVTEPIGWFAGVWVALEDVAADAGPVEYFHGTHRLFDNRQKLLSLRAENGTLDSYFENVRTKAISNCTPSTALLKRGDVLIWHHAMPHSGTPAIDPARTRHSMVFHMGSEGINIRLSGLFDPPPRYELPRYGWFRHGQRRVARVGLPAFMY